MDTFPWMHGYIRMPSKVGPAGTRRRTLREEGARCALRLAWAQCDFSRVFYNLHSAMSMPVFTIACHETNFDAIGDLLPSDRKARR